MMRRPMLAVPVLAAALLAAGCSGSPETPVSPSQTAPAALGAAEDGSTLKVNAPSGLSPSGGAEVTSNQVTLVFQPAAGRHVQPLGMQHRVELYDGQQRRIAQWTTPGATVTTPVLEYNESYAWRVQGILDGREGPWSQTATFVVPTPPIPAECMAQPLAANRLPCVLAVASLSDEWPRCQGGSGSACHRFTREVARALSIGDPLWGLLGKVPGTWQCTPTTCGSNISGGLGEDVVVYCTGPGTCRNPNGPGGRTDWVAIDIILGAGAPGAQIAWSPIARVNNRGDNWWVPVP